MTNNCYCYRGIYDMYRVGADPVKLNQQFYCRKRIIRNRLFHKGRIYWFSHDVLHKIHEIHRTMVDTDHRIHYFMRRIVHFAYKSAMSILRLNAPIQVAFMVALTVLDGCALIAILYHQI